MLGPRARLVLAAWRPFWLAAGAARQQLAVMEPLLGRGCHGSRRLKFERAGGRAWRWFGGVGRQPGVWYLPEPRGPEMLRAAQRRQRASASRLLQPERSRRGSECPHLRYTR